MIADGATIAGLARERGGYAAALDKYGTSQARRFSIEHAGFACCECRIADGVRLLRCSWRGTHHPLYLAPLLLLAVSLGVHHIGGLGYTAGFTTHHPMCRACGRSFFRGRALSVLFNACGLLSLAVGGLLLTTAAFLILLELVETRPAPRPSFWAMAGVGCAGFGVILLFLQRCLPLPRPLRLVARRPFRLTLARWVTK